MRKLKPTKRTMWLAGLSILVLAYHILTDPNGGALTAAVVGQLVTPIIAVWFALLVRKILFDYFDMGTVFSKAMENAIGAGLVFLGTCVVFFALLGLFGNQVRAQSVTTYIPVQAQQYLPVVKAEQKVHWETHPKHICLQV